MTINININRDGEGCSVEPHQRHHRRPPAPDDARPACLPFTKLGPLYTPLALAFFSAVGDERTQQPASKVDGSLSPLGFRNIQENTKGF